MFKADAVGLSSFVDTAPEHHAGRLFFGNRFRLVFHEIIRVHTNIKSVAVLVCHVISTL